MIAICIGRNEAFLCTMAMSLSAPAMLYKSRTMLSACGLITKVSAGVCGGARNAKMETLCSPAHRSCTRSFSTATGGEYDLAVVGGGIVGLATAREILARNPGLRLAVLEKESEVGFHQTGHNSGVIHAGIYYPPGSLKAKLCVEGLDLTYKYCDEHKIPYKKCGKLIIAVNDSELEGLEQLYKRGVANGVKDMTFMSKEEFTKIEPHCKGVRAIFSPHTGIVDWGLVARHYAQDVKAAGGAVLLSHEVETVASAGGGSQYANGVQLGCVNGARITAANVVFCAGAYADRLARKSGGEADPMIVPVRGEYLELDESQHHLVNSLIYPVPDPSVPFLGVHFTPTMGSVATGQGPQVLIGPNAVVAFAREGYSWAHINPRDLFEAALFPGLWRLGLKHFGFGIGEMYRSLYLPAQMSEINKYIPGIKLEHVRRGRAGVRAQAMDRMGTLVDDFVFDEDCPRALLHVRNSPSPGATSSLAIGNMIAEKAAGRFNLAK